MSADAARELLERIADGTPIDWDRVGGVDAALLESAHTLDAVRHAYRRIGSNEPGERVLFRWGGLSVLELLASGATAEVYRAWDAGLSTMVALKLLRPEAAVAGLRSEEFLREGHLLARIGQRNVLRVYGAAVHDGRPGLWAEWIDGRTLEASVAADGPLAAAEAVHVGLELCAALGAIHAAGLVHGDVKASNALRERGGRIVLADFGAGGTPDALNASPRTQATPAYLSPQSRDGAPRSAADDLYALGVLLHFLLTGAYLRNDAPALRTLAAGDAQPVAADVERALAPEPAQRHADAYAFADALRAAIGGAPPTSRPRRRWPAAAAIAALALAGIGAWQIWRPVPWEPQATLVRHGGADAALRDGASLHIGERLDLVLASDRPTWVWVLNEDAAGSFHVLFPLSGLQRANPLPRGDSVLPGEQGGRALSWQVSSAGGREEFLVVLADAPLAKFEQRIATFAAASIDAPERGVARVAAAPLGGVALHGPHLHALLDEFASEFADHRHVRVIGYRFGDVDTP